MWTSIGLCLGEDERMITLVYSMVLVDFRVIYLARTHWHDYHRPLMKAFRGNNTIHEARTKYAGKLIPTNGCTSILQTAPKSIKHPFSRSLTRSYAVATQIGNKGISRKCIFQKWGKRQHDTTVKNMLARNSLECKSHRAQSSGRKRIANHRRRRRSGTARRRRS